MYDFEGNRVLDENGDLPFEECFMIQSGDQDKMTALNNLLADGYYIYDSFAVGDSVFIRLRNSNEE